MDLISSGGSWSSVALGEALTAPDDDPADAEIQLVEKLQVQEGRTKVEEPLVVISPPSDSLSSRTESPSWPSSNVELFQSTLVKMRDTCTSSRCS